LRVLALALLFLPQLALALGLGDIRLNSRLNAPLDAEIELLGATAEELSTLKAQLASRETFARYALEWPAFLSSVTVDQVRSGDGRTLLRLRSQDPVTEPFVTMLVEVNWARGRLVREYTVLIDPPVFAPGESQAAAPVAAPSVGAPRQGEIARPAPAPRPDIAPAPTRAPAAPVSADGSYTVRQGDTLTAIASRLTGGADSQRMMLGLYQGNPEAFGGNMSDLHSGAVLRVPDAATLAAISAGDASAEVRRQYAAWSGRSAATPGDERLRLVPPSQAGAEAGSGAAAGAQVEQLNSRVRQLESELQQARNQLEIRNRELAALQARIEAASGEPAPVTTPEPQVAGETEVPAEDVLPPPDQVATEPSAVEPEAQTAAGEEAAEVEAQPETLPAPAAAPAPVEEGTSILDTLRQFWFVPALLLALLLGLFGYRKWKAGQENDFDNSLGRLAEAGAEAVERRTGLTDTARLRKPVGGDEDDAFLVEESGSHERPRLDESGTFRKPPTVVTTTADQTISGETAINLDQGDPLAEADFHMAYGLYDQAADLVRIAIAREPQRRDLKLKLLEVFFVWGNKDQFLSAARDLATSRDDAPAGEWDKIVIMGKQLAPDDPLFQHASSAGGAIAGGIDLDLEGGQNRVDYDLLGDPGGEAPRAGVDLDFNTALGGEEGDEIFGDKDPTGEAGQLIDPAGVDLDFVLDDPSRGADHSGLTTREMTAQMPGEQTVERTALLPDSMDAPTVEQPMLRTGEEHTIRQKLEMALPQQGAGDPTAELAIDDLGLDLGTLDAESGDPASDAPTMVAGLDARSRQIIEDAERQAGGDADQASATGSWYTIESTDQTGTNPAIADVNATASLRALTDLPEGEDGSETSRLAALKATDVDIDFGATDAFGAAARNGLDLDVGSAGADNDGAFAATQKIGPEDLALPDLEPVTMSEVGTKLDLARAYMDMGDPDGARSILKEVLQEGSVSQKQEAQRLIDTLPG
jgi:pilus assembly protein FimV